MKKLLNNLPMYVLSVIVMFAAYHVKGYEGLLAVSGTLLYLAIFFS